MRNSSTVFFLYAAGINNRLKLGLQKFGHFRWIAGDLEAALFHHLQFGVGSVRPTRNQRTRVAHTFAGRGGNARNEPDHRLLHVGLAPTRRLGFIRATNFANHDDRVRIRVVIEQLHDIDVFEPVDRVPADTDGAGLAQPDLGQLRHRFIGQGAGTANHTNASFAVDVTRHDADLDFVRRNQTRTVGTQQQRVFATCCHPRAHPVAHFQHVTHRDSLSDTDRQVKVGLHRFPYSGRGTCWRHVNHRRGGTGLCCRFLDRGKDRDTENCLTRLLGVDASDKTVLSVGVLLTFFRVELAGLAGNALGDDFGGLVDQDAHWFSSALRAAML